MMISIGAILMIIGAAASAWQWDAVWTLLRGGGPLLLLGLGIITFLIGYSQHKARRFYRNNVQDSSVQDGAIS